jgi:RNA polymerase sigma-70 factor (ECF subfamily)
LHRVSLLPSAVVQLGLVSASGRPAPSEAERAALHGDRDAWSRLIAKHERRVVLSLLAAGVPPAEAREFAHDAWLRVMEQADAGRLEYLPLPGLVVRQALFLARAAARKPQGTPEDLAAPPSIEEQYFTRERLERARAAVERLPGSSREVFLLLYAQPQLAHAEVAARVGLSVQRVRQILCEVRKTLRAELEEEPPHVRPVR